MSHETPDPNDEHGSVYDGLLGTDTSQWAFGTDFEDPLAGVDTTVPAELDAGELAAHCLALADDALVISHRLSEWCSNAPDLEEDIALANIALDLLGQARLLLFATVRLAAFERLTSHADPVLAAIAAKGVKELTYHRDYAGRWFLTLAQGTDESRRRLLAGLTALWPLYDELRAAYDAGPDVDVVLDQVFAVSAVERPDVAPMSGRGHTEALSRMLAEMQVVARAHPSGLW